MSNFADLANELNEDAIPEVNPADLPEQKGSTRRELLYPGPYTFTLPTSFDGKVDDTGDRKIVVAQFYDELALTTKTGQRWTGQLTNRPYEVTEFKANGERERITVNDLALLFKSQGYAGSLASSGAYIKALLQYPGGKFQADITWSAYCNPKKPIYKDDQKQDGTSGCGAAYDMRGYTKKDGTVVHELPKGDDGRYADQIQCSCGAELRVNDKLTRIRAAKTK